METLNEIASSEERRKLSRQAALLVSVILGLTTFFPSMGACFTITNADLPEGTWALLAPALLLPAVVVCALSPRLGAALLAATSIVSSVALALWIIRVGWLDGFSVLVLELVMIAGLALMFWWSAPSKQVGDARLNR